MQACDVIEKLRRLSGPAARDGMAKVGINAERALGVDTTRLRSIAKVIGKDHGLALALWDTGIHEARIIAAWVDDPGLVTEEQMDTWVLDFNSWDICDHTCWTLFDKTPFAYPKCLEWADDGREYVKRAGFVMMASLAVHDKKASDTKFLTFFPAIVKCATDERNFVKKGVSWALRQIGKRNLALNMAAIGLAYELGSQESGAARWIAADARRELCSAGIKSRLIKWDARRQAK